MLKLEIYRSRLIIGLLFVIYLVVFLSVQGFSDYSSRLKTYEQFTTLFSAIICCFMFNNNDENELIVSSRYSLLRLSFLKISVILSCSFLFDIVGLLFLFEINDYAYVLLSVVGTLLFLCFTGFCIRILFRSSYASSCMLIMIFIILDFVSTIIKNGNLNKLAFIDLFCDSYLLGTYIWSINRFIFLAFSLAIILVCIKLLKKDRL